MRFSIKRIISTFIAASIILGSVSNIYGAVVNMDLVYDGVSHKYSAEEVHITIDGKAITGLDVPPVIINERTMVPARAVFENMGCDIAWNEATQEVYIMHNTDLIVLKIDSNQGTKNGTAFSMDTPAKIVNDRTLIPVRAVSEAIGCQVGWDDASRTVAISTTATEQPNENTDNNTSDNNGDNSSGTTENNGNSSDGEGTIINPIEPGDNNGSSSSNGGQSTGGDTSANTEVINITSITVPESEKAEQKFTINASGAIGSYNSFVLENNRLVIDINNANMNIANTNITATNSTIVSAVRSAQNQTEPTKITRVVFDLNSLADYSVNLSSDKKSIEVSFKVSRVSNIALTSSNGADYVNIYGDTNLSVETYMLTNPDRVVINVFNAVSSLDETYPGDDCNYIKDVRTTQYDSKTVQIVADVNRLVEAEVIKKNGYTSVCITKSSLDNISYNASSHTLTLLNASDISSSDITHTDNYMGGTYKLTLDGDYSELFGTGTIKCNDDYLSSIKVGLDSNGNTYFEASENKIVAVKTKEYSDSIEISFVSPKEVYDKIVVIDAGHGKNDNGASGNGLTEKSVNLQIVQKLYALLEADPNIKVYATRLDDSYPTNASRAQMANEVADLFVSIHQNSNTSSTPQGTEVLYMNHSNEISAPSSKLTSKAAAQIALTWVINALGTTNRGIKERPDLIVLNQTTVPAILIETCFISNPDDAAKVKSEENINKLANNIYSAISIMLNDYDLR